MKFVKALGLTLSVIASASCQAVGEESGTMKAWIDVDEQGDTLELRSMAIAAPSAELTYTLIVERTSAAGTSRSDQGGSVTVQDETPLVLSRSGVNALRDGTLTARLEVTDSTGQTATDTVELSAGN